MINAIANRARRVGLGAAMVMTGLSASHAIADESGWQTLFEEPPSASWIDAGSASLDSQDSSKLHGVPGDGVLISTRRGTKRERNLTSPDHYGDAEVRLEFMLSRGSNAGVKMQGLYEVQLYDSHGKAVAAATDCGGIYPRAVRKPRYHHIDKGFPPLSNAAKPAGQWQTLYIRFRAPTFDNDGAKKTSAVFEEVRINGEVVQQNVTVPMPTGAYWQTRDEVARGPLYLQGDHGPVAYRSVEVRPLATPRADAG
ncbi:MAG: DUF1080 domain-containing protein [Planctomycetota bacterium]